MRHVLRIGRDVFSTFNHQADPFGDDTIDFKLEKFLEASFKNTLALLAVERDVCSYTPLVASPVDYALD